MLSYNILSIPNSDFTSTELYELIMLLLSIDLDIKQISYCDIVRLLIRGKSYEFDANSYDTHTRYMYKGKKNKYSMFPENARYIGVPESHLFDLSFFLKLNY